MTLLNIWELAQPALKEKIGPTTYESWFSSLRIREENPETLLIETPDEFFKNWIIERYLPVIKSVLLSNTEKKFEIVFSVNPALTKDTLSDTKIFTEEPVFENRKETIPLNARFSFDNFVVGPSNRFSYAACRAVAESPAKAYNPLFIYGHVGLGKTHLMQAITQQVKLLYPNIQCAYLSSERFTNELIDAIRHKSTSQFRQKYRNIDVLLIDDIHFIAGKESTQEEFFHTFNALHNNRKQIIISSDRPPKEIAKLEERLSSRFAWGLITDIQPPDFETRVAILKKKTERESVPVPDNVITFIAEQIKTNIRELEGALIRVVACSLLEERLMSLDMAKTILKDMVKETTKIISIEMIQKKAAEFFNISLVDLKSPKRSKNIIYPRQVAMHLSRQLTNLSLPEIGNAFGGKDHTTVLHACKKIDKEKESNKELRNAIEKLTILLAQ